MAGENLNDLFDAVPEGETLEIPVIEEVATPAEVETETVVEPEVTTDEVQQVVDEVLPEPEADPAPDKTSSSDEVSQLRIILREQNRRIRELQSQMEKSTTSLTEKGLLEEQDAEILEAEKTANTLRAIQLETILETMRINPKFEDVDAVVSQSRFDDMIEGYAFAQAQKAGGNAEDYIDAVADKIWAMPNPYRFMYEKIKQYHPDFKASETPVAEPDPKPSTPPSEKKVEPKPKTAPTTISNLPASNAETGGWTSARIDGMTEEDLGKVPKDIYHRYLSGDLK